MTVICILKRVKSIVFAVSIKFCDELGLAILIYDKKKINLPSLYHAAAPLLSPINCAESTLQILY